MADTGSLTLNSLITNNYFSHCAAMMTEGIFRIPGAKNRINQVGIVYKTLCCAMYVGRQFIS